jgi:hypothetical protein
VRSQFLGVLHGRGLAFVIGYVLSGNVMAWPKSTPWEIIWPDDEQDGRRYHFCIKKRSLGKYSEPYELRIDRQPVPKDTNRGTWLNMYTSKR